MSYSEHSLPNKRIERSVYYCRTIINAIITRNKRHPRRRRRPRRVHSAVWFASSLLVLITKTIMMGSLAPFAAAGVRTTYYLQSSRRSIRNGILASSSSSRGHSTHHEMSSSSSSSSHSIQSWHHSIDSTTSPTKSSIHNMAQSRGRFGVHKEESRSIKCRSFSTIARGGATIPSATDIHERMDNDKSDAKREIAYIAVGSNLGDRFGNIQNAMELLESYHLGAFVDGQQQRRRPLIEIRHTSHLHQTAAMYVTDQPAFLNGVIAIETTLSPQELLVALKEVEQAIGRDLKNGIRNGPRLIDMDILFYGVISPSPRDETHAEEEENGKGSSSSSSSSPQDIPRSGGCILQTPNLEIPHPRLEEREFVLLPLCELDQTVVHPVWNVTLAELFQRWKTRSEDEDTKLRNNDEPPPSRAVRVLPLPRNRMLFLNETLVMGILNVTPDSFSDGGRLGGSVERATQEALQMVADGASIIDIGGESTRPGAKEIQLNEEIKRTIPVIQNIRQVSDIPISIDTRHATVAKAAIEAGADIVNDVSGGTFDPDMLSTVAELKVPMVLMHMRGTPETMQGLTHYSNGVVSDVAHALLERSMEAERAGIPRWLQVLDPGIGFAKDLSGNLQLLKHAGKLRELLGPFPLLLGPSRKGFIGTITGETDPKERDYGTVASCVAAVCSMNPNENGGSSNILRVHNVKAVKQAALIMDAIRQTK